VEPFTAFLVSLLMLMDSGQVLETVEERRIELIRLDYVDWGGMLRGRVVGREQLADAFASGLNSAQTNLTISVDDHESDPALGAHTGDVWYVPDPATFVALPWQPGYGHMLVDVVQNDGQPWFGDPRAALRRTTAQALQELGRVRLGFEQEGHLLRRDGDRFVPAFNTRFFSADFPDYIPRFFLDMTHALRTMGTPLEKFTVEGSHGMPELNVRYNDPLPAADAHARFKLAFRAIARQHGLVGSFMPKPFAEYPGAGCHVHISVADPDSAEDRFAAAADARGLGLSDLAYYFVGGLLEHAGALCAIGSPTVNSYKRLQPGMWAPSMKGYGLGNRSAMLRVVEPRPCDNRLRRLELRTPDGTANSYLLAAAVIACGLDGVRRRLEPGPPADTDFGHITNTSYLESLPRSLDRALDALEKDEVLRAALGPGLLDGVLKLKRLEWATFSASVTDWEQRTYADFF
jgi:glutamine synthetase